MLVIPVKDGENIDRALKRFKRKFLQTKVLKEIRERKEFTKKSDRLRVKKQKAIFSENVLRNTEWLTSASSLFYNSENLHNSKNCA